MIKLADVEQAIIECYAQRNPDANTCKTLAALYTIRDHMNGTETGLEEKPINQGYSYNSGATIEKTIDYYSDTDFARAIGGKDAVRIWSIIDELMTVLQATNTRLYNGVMRKIE